MGATAAVIGAITAIVGAGATVYQTQQAAEDRKDEKDRLEKQAARDAEIHREETAELLSKQRAAYAASGVLVGEGTPLAVLEETQRERDEELEAILSGYGVTMDRLDTEASRIRTSGMFEAGGTLLGGVANYASSPYAINPFETTTPAPTYKASGPFYRGR